MPLLPLHQDIFLARAKAHNYNRVSLSDNSALHGPEAGACLPASAWRTSLEHVWRTPGERLENELTKMQPLLFLDISLHRVREEAGAKIGPPRRGAAGKPGRG